MGYMALIRSTSLTRSYVRISLRGICVLSVNEVAETWKVPSKAATPMVFLVATPASRSRHTETYDCP